MEEGAGAGHPNFLTWFWKHVSAFELCVFSNVDEQPFLNSFSSYNVVQCTLHSSVHNDLRIMSRGCKRFVKVHGCYDINGFRFRSSTHELSKPNLRTVNSCILCYGDDGVEYYDIIQEIIELVFEGSKELSVVLFRCNWFDPIRGVRRRPDLGLVEVKHTSRLDGYDPFILANQAEQVYYLPYPCQKDQTGRVKRGEDDLSSWWVVYKVRRPGRLVVPTSKDYASPVQEQRLNDTFVIDIGSGLDNLTATIDDDVEEEHDAQEETNVVEPSPGDPLDVDDNYF